MYIHNTVFAHAGMAPITHGRATMTLDGLDCEVAYNITAEGSFNGTLVIPSHGAITSGPCPPGMLL